MFLLNKDFVPEMILFHEIVSFALKYRCQIVFVVIYRLFKSREMILFHEIVSFALKYRCQIVFLVK